MDEEVYVTPNGFPGIRQVGDEQIAAKLEKLWVEDATNSGLDKADKRLIERIQRIAEATK